jgi:hypothetical protein
MHKFLFAMLSVSVTALTLSISGCGGSSNDGGGSTGGVSMGVAKSPDAASSAVANAAAGTSGSGGAGSAHDSADGTSAVNRVAEAAAVIGPASSTGVADTIVGTVTPTGTVETDLHATTHVTVTFTTNDGGTATKFSLATAASSLPAGWTVTSSSAPCAQVNTGTSCTVTLNYAPTLQAPSGRVTLNYNYTDNIGRLEIGHVYIPYTPVSHNAYVVATWQMERCGVASSGDIPACSPAPAPPEFVDAVTFHNGLVYFTGGSSVWICGLAPTGITTCSQFTGALTAPQGIAFSASYAYISDSTGPVSRCSVGSNGTLSNCSTMIIPGSDNAKGLAVYGSTLLVASYSNNQIIECTLDASGNATDCAPAAVSGVNEPLDFALVGSTLYVDNQQVVNSVLQCTFGSNGRISSCTDAGVHNLYSASGITFIGNDAYIASPYDYLIDRCSVAANGKLSNCVSATSATDTFNSLPPPTGVIFF